MSVMEDYKVTTIYLQDLWKTVLSLYELIRKRDVFSFGRQACQSAGYRGVSVLSCRANIHIKNNGVVTYIQTSVKRSPIAEVNVVSQNR